MKIKRIAVLLLLGLCLFSFTAEAKGGKREAEAQSFLRMYNELFQPMYVVQTEATWGASTDVTDMHVGERIGADKVGATFAGNRWVIEQVRSYLRDRKKLSALTIRQLNAILQSAANYPGTLPAVVAERVEAEAKQSAIVDGFDFCLDRKGDKCGKKITPNEIEKVLQGSNSLDDRLRYWNASKDIGVPLKPGLVKLRDLRNRLAREMGYSSFFALQVDDYDMKIGEMRALLQLALQETRPLYQSLHCWAKRKLADRYKQSVPKRIPAHWLGNRWGQEWPGLAEGVEMDDLLKGKSAEWIVKTAENFYISLGMPPLPESFWKKSDLYALPADAKRKKNTHASAWHMDLEHDVRSLMSVEPNWYWFGTAHHELGHIYYYLAYARPEVPPLLREGVNRAFHEALGDLIFIASTQPSYLREIGILPADKKIDSTQWLLNQALEEAPVFLPWSAGVMTEFEHDLYEKNLPEGEFNHRWWELVAKYQGIDPPAAVGVDRCDACTKTHINDDPAQYYDYALAHMMKYQLHQYICRNIVHSEPHDCDYSGNKKVGEFLMSIMRLGKTRDWRSVFQDATGEPMGSSGVISYFAPVENYLNEQNKGRNCSFND